MAEQQVIPTESIRTLRKRMENALTRAEQESMTWEAERARIKRTAADSGAERIMCKESLPLNDAFKALAFWQQQTMMYAAVMSAEIDFQRMRQGG